MKIKKGPTATAKQQNMLRRLEIKMNKTKKV